LQRAYAITSGVSLLIDFPKDKFLRIQSWGSTFGDFGNLGNPPWISVISVYQW
jgi:hypothetical protein